MAFPASQESLSADVHQTLPLTQRESGLPPLQRPNSAAPLSLVFVDSGVTDAAQLLAHSSANSQVFYLNTVEDAVTQITRTLLNYENVGSLHILSHGESGSLNFANGRLSQNNLSQYTTQIKSWSQALSTDADILLYGCDVAGGTAGAAFIRELGQLTQAEVAASTNLTGAGGDWILEASTGIIESALVSDETGRSQYRYSLDSVQLLSNSNSTLASDAIGGDLGDRSVSSNGNLIVFSSAASNLVAGDSNGKRDVFLFDRAANTITLVSHALAGLTQPSNGESSNASISADGNFVVFTSTGSNLTSETKTGSNLDVFRWNRSTGAIELISKAGTTAGVGGDSTTAVISADGGTIAFLSTATNLTGADITDTNNARDAFVWSQSGLKAISLDQFGTTTADRGVGNNLDISADGRFIVFNSQSVLNSSDNNGNANDIYLYDNTFESIDLISLNASGNAGGASTSIVPRVSFVGNKLRVLFTSFGRLTAEDSSTLEDVYVAEKDFVDPDNPFVLRLVSRVTNALDTANNGKNGDSNSSNAVFSGNGRYVAFTSNSTNLVAGDTNAVQDVFVHDLDAADPNTATKLVSRNSAAGALGNGSSGSQISLSDDGNIVAFTSAATNLVDGVIANDINGAGEDLFAYNTTTNTLTLVTRKNGATTSATLPTLGAFQQRSIRVVTNGTSNSIVYTNDATDLVDKDTNDANDIFSFNLTTPANTLITKIQGNSASATGFGNANLTAIGNVSRDGRYVVFVSDANSLVAGDRNSARDVFLRDTTLPITNPDALKLVSRTATGSGDQLSSQPFISADGQYIVFSSAATDLVPGDTNAQQDIFLYTVSTGATTLVSRTAVAASDNASSSPSVAVDAGGEVYVAFISRASNLGATSTGVNNVFVWKKSTGTIALVSKSSPTAGGNLDSSTPIISADGKYIAFTSNASNLTVANFTGVDGNNSSDVFLYDIATGVLNLASQNANVVGNGASYNPIISDTNGVVAFESRASNLTAIADTNNAADIFRYSTAAGTTLVSVNAAGNASGSIVAGGSGSTGASISADGNTIAFTSDSNNLSATTDTNNKNDVFVRNVTAATTTLISRSLTATTNAANGSSDNAVLSADGKLVAFTSTATDLASQDTSSSRDVFTSSTALPSARLVSSGTASSNGDAASVSLSSDGGLVVFETNASNLVANDLNGRNDIFSRPTRPTVGFKVVDALASEGTTDTGTYELTRSETSGALQVKLKLSDLVPLTDATASDLTLTADQGAIVTIAAGIVTVTMPDTVAKVTLTLTALVDTLTEGSENAILTLEADSTYTIDPLLKTGTVVIAPSGTLVTNTNDSGVGSLRQAIANARLTPGADVITFALTNPALKTITLLTPLDALTGDITIDGGTSGIILNGASAAAGTNGLTLAGNNNVVKGITVTGFTGNGILIEGNNNTIGGIAAGNGNNVNANKLGVYVKSGTGNQILGNTITNNTDLGIDIEPIGVAATDLLLLTTANATATGATINGTLTGAAGTYRIEFFSNATTDTVGRTEGETYLGFQDVTITGTSAPVVFNSTIVGLAGKYISATVTDTTTKTTSEFVKDIRVITPLPTVDVISAEAVTGVDEGNTATTDYKFTVKLSRPVTADTVFKYRTLAGTGATGAIADTDFIGVSNGTVTVLSGSATATITVKVKGDTRFEANKTFNVELFDIDAAIYTAGTVRAEGIIKNDDLKPTITFESPTFSGLEGQAAPNRQLPFKINLSNESDEVITVTYETVDGTGATGAISTGADKDFTAQAATVLTFNPGEITKTVNVELIADAVNEPAETFGLRLSAPSNATFAGTATTLEATGTITPDEGPVVELISAEVATGVDEGNTATTDYKFTVKLSSPVTADTVFKYRTLAGTGATGAIADTDFIGVSNGTVTVLSGSATATLTVKVKGDTRFEANKTFNVELFDIDAAIYTAGTVRAAGIIKNDDLKPTITFESPTFSAIEGQTAPNNQLPFKINLSNESDEAITVTYATVDGTGATGATSAAGAGQDFTAQAATVLTFNPGEITKTVNVEMIADTVDEPAETFALRLSLPTNATFAGTATTLEATGTITPDESPYTFAVTADNPTVIEGNSGTKIVKFTVTLDRDPQEDLTIEYSTLDGTAIAGIDFVNNGGTLTFARNGSRTKTIDVVINSNTTLDGNRDFSLRLSDPTPGRAIIDATKTTANTTIQDDDLPTLSFKVGNTGDVRRVEGTAGTTTTAEVVVELSEISTQDVTVEFTTLDGTGANAATIADQDYEARTTAGQKITIRKGQKNATASFTIVGDNKIEQDETFFVKISNPIGAILSGSDTQAVIIEDDDTLISNQPKVSIAAVNASQDEGAAGTTKTYTFSVTLDKAPAAGQPVSVNVSTLNGTGTTGATSADNDFVAKTELITFNLGDPLTKTFTVQVNGDNKIESTETFSVVLGTPTNATLLTSTAIATIRDDDTPVGTKPVISISPATLAQLEGNSGTKAYTYTIQLDRLPAVGENVTVDVTTVDGIGSNGAISTGANADFTAKTQSFTFTSTGSLTQDFTVLVNGDTQIEPDEIFTVELRNTVNATLGRTTATATITDDDTPIVTLPRISITPVTQNEGNSGTTPFTFRIQLDKAPAAGQIVSVEVATVDGVGSNGAISSGSNADFTAKTQTFTFTSTGALTQDFTVLVNGDTQTEQTETFTIALRNVTGAVLSTNQVIGTITNDDTLNSGGSNNISIDSLNDILWRNPTTGETLLWQTNLGPTTRANIIPNNYDPSTWRYGGTADFNKDGSPDVLWHNTQTGEVIIWKTNGNAIEAVITPRFNALGSAVLVPGQWHIEDISDYTGDNKPDIFWRNYQTNQIVVWEMNGFDYVGDKYLSQPISLDWKVEAIADFTGAGSKAVFWRNQKTGSTVLWKIAGEQWTNGGWTGKLDLNVNLDSTWKVVGTGDMNGDRTSDVLWQNTVSGSAVVWYMGRSGLLQREFLPKPTEGFTIGGAADFNLDGITDLLLQNPLTRENKIWYLQQGPTGILYGSSASLPNAAPGSQFLGISQASGSTVPQLIWRNVANRDLITWQISSSPSTTSTPYSTLSNPDLQILWTGDLDNTGKAKVITRNQLNGIIEIGDLTNGLYTKISNLLPLDRNWVYRGIGDVDADGIKDIFWQNIETGKVEIWKVGGSRYAQVLAPQLVPGPEWVINQIADFDADGQADVFWRNTRTQQTAIWLMNGQEIKDRDFVGRVSFDWQVMKVADFDRNGTADLLWRNSQTGEVVTWLMDGKTIKKGNQLITVNDPAWVIKTVADFDRDGNNDILWYNSQTKQTVIWKMQDGQYQSRTLLPNVPSSSWDLVGTRDFNADGSLDLLWLDRATGTPTIWYLNGMNYGSKVTLPDLPNPNFQVIGLDDFNQVPA